MLANEGDHARLVEMARGDRPADLLVRGAPPSGPIDFEKAARIGPKYGLEIIQPKPGQ